MRSVTASRNQRSWVTTSTAKSFRALRCRANQSTPSTSRWFVGSSSMMRSSSSIKSFAKPTRRFSPPERVMKTRSKRWSSKPPNRPVKTSRIFGSLAHSCFSLSPITISPTVALLSATSTWESMPTRTEFPCVTLPSSARSRPAIIFIRVLLPAPFRPTIPMRSPSETPIETLINNGRISKALLTPSRLTRLRAIVDKRTFAP